MRVGTALVLALSVLLTTPAASAEPERRWFYVDFVGDRSDLVFTLSTERDSAPFLRCRGRCYVPFWAGDYWLSTKDTSDIVAGQRHITLEEPTRVRIRARTKSEQGAHGLTIAGFTLSAMGAGALVYGLSRPERTDFRDGMLVLGAMSLVAGLIMLPLGNHRDTRTDPVLTLEH